MDAPQPSPSEAVAPSPTGAAFPKIRPVTTLIIAAAILATFWSWTHPDDAYLALHAGGYDLWIGTRFHALITSALLHGDFLHLVFNIYWLGILGTFLEGKLGSARYALFALGSAFIASVAELAWAGGMGVGLSGVIYAIFGVLLLWRNQDSDTASVLPPGRIALFVGWFFLCMILTQSGLMPIANAAHAGGLFAGLWYGAANRSSLRRFRPAVGALVLVVAVAVVFWAPWHENWHLAQLKRLESSGPPEAFRAAALEFARRFPDNRWGRSYDLWNAQTTRDHARIAELCERMLAVERDANTLNNLAWLRATCPDPALRNGAEAVGLAREACALSGWKLHYMVNTLAAALAETGRFEEAVAMNEKAIALAADSDRPVLTPYTEAFRAGRPWREEPAPAATP